MYRLSTLQLAMKLLGTVMGAALLEVDVWLLSLLGAGVGALAIPLIVLLAPSSHVAAGAPAAASAPLLCPPAAAPPGYGTMVAVVDDAGDANAPGTASRAAWDKSGAGAGTTVAVRSLAAGPGRSSSRHRRFGLLGALLRDPLMRVTLLMYLCHGTALSVAVNLPQWAVKRFGFKLAQANAITSLSLVVNGLVLLKAPQLSARLLRPSL